MSIYDSFKEWSAGFKRTDIVRAVIGIAIIALVLFLLTGCGTHGPSMTLAPSLSGDAFIEVRQPVYQSQVTCTPPKHEVFIDYLHHSEIWKESNEDTYDGVRIGYTHNFGKWRWQK